MTEEKPSMDHVLVIVPFPMSENNLAKRRAQLDAVELGRNMRLVDARRT